MTPRLANIIIAADGEVNSATNPISSAPIGPAPIARDITPSARPRISSDAVMTTMVDCIVPNPAVPSPSSTSTGSDSSIHCDQAKMKTSIRPNSEPPR